MDAAQRTPKGQSYDPPPKKGGVEYKQPVGPNPVDEEEQVLSILNEKGQEIPDPVPMEPPIGYSSAPSLADFVHRMIHTQLSQVASDQDMETFEEADDFDIEDDPVDPLTPYEEVFMPPPTPVGGGGGAKPPSGQPTPAAASPPVPSDSPPASTTTTPNETP